MKDSVLAFLLLLILGGLILFIEPWFLKLIPFGIGDYAIVDLLVTLIIVFYFMKFMKFIDEKNRLYKLFKKARYTGEKQEIKNFYTPCNDHNVECTTDQIIVYALPGGTTEEVRIHTGD